MTLVIYSASAGSGKTHHLTLEFLKLCFRNPDNFRHILAVTFTNKATAEMKSRIISELYKISRGDDTSVLTELKLTFNHLTEEKLRLTAHRILKAILYSYHYFNVSTIDSFFQTIMRAFTRELGIYQAYNLELDTQKVLKEVTDTVIRKAGEDLHLGQWLVSFAFDKFTELQNWNFDKDIEELAAESIKEHFVNYLDGISSILSDQDKIRTYLRALNDIIHEFEHHQRQLAEKAMKMIDSAGLEVSDFSNKDKGVAGWISKLMAEPAKKPGTRVGEALNDKTKWYTSAQKSEIKERIDKLLSSGLFQLTKDLYDYYFNRIRFYYTASLIKKHFYVFGIMGHLLEELKHYRTENNMLMLSDVNQLIYQLTQTEDSPFIFEKTGSWLHHIFIDEFQDTSGYQWHNLKKLILNNLASGYRNLIVGDVKQSIYRWRGGDWSLLLRKVYEDIDQNLIQQISLDKNYRSCREIIEFNNQLFTALSAFLSDKFIEIQNVDEVEAEDLDFAGILREAYRDVIQKIPENKPSESGLVSISYLITDEESKWKAKVNSKLIDLLKELEDQGYQPEDIAILTRTNLEGKEITAFLLQNTNLTIVSQETLSLESSVVLRFIIACLKYYLDKNDLLNLAEMQFLYYRLKYENQDQLPDFQYLNEILYQNKTEHLTAVLMQIISENTMLSLYALVKTIVNEFELSGKTDEQAYLTAFLNMIVDFQGNYRQSVPEFVEFWEEKGKYQSVRVSDETPGLKVMTIHKSKGLQFKIVIIPYCSWKIDHYSGKTQIIWCKPDTLPFSNIPVVPVKYGNIMKESFFHREYYIEKLYAWMDNLNAMYVAFTRAENALYVFSELPEKNLNQYTAGSLLYQMLTGSNTFLNQYFDPSTNTFNYGSLILKPVEETVRAVMFEDYPSVSGSGLPVTSVKTGTFKRIFFPESSYSPREMGKKLHAILSRIRYADDLQLMLAEPELSGDLNENEKKELIYLAESIVNHPDLKDWFSSGWEILTEQAILIPDSTYKIPDRIMIQGKKAIIVDFKFSEPQKKYHLQVAEYAHLLSQMGYHPVEAYLVFIDQKSNITRQQVVLT